MPTRHASLLADPPPRAGRLWLTNAVVFDGTGSPLKASAGVLIQDGRIAAVGRASDGCPEGSEVLDLGGRTLMPGLIDAHSHVYTTIPRPRKGAEPIVPGVGAHFLAADLRAALRMGITTLRDVGSYGDEVMTARQAIRYGAFRGPRLLTCGSIIAATSPGGRFFNGMYREADGPDEIRRAVREQLRRGADFIKVMATGARSVELEDPEPAQLTREEMAALVDEAHRLGYRVAAHAEGLAGTQLAISEGVDTIEHGMYLNQRPDLLEVMAAAGQVLVPTLSCFYEVAGFGEAVGIPPVAQRSERWAPALADLARYNLDQAELTLNAARDLGVPIALGYDWEPISKVGLEICRMVHHGLSAAEALVAATSTAARALGLAGHLGTVEVSKLADLVVVDGNPLAAPSLLRSPEAIWLVLQLGQPVAGACLDQHLPSTGTR
jgi:imidazolonepropionase-like amidohydrolase